MAYCKSQKYLLFGFYLYCMTEYMWWWQWRWCFVLSGTIYFSGNLPLFLICQAPVMDTILILTVE